MTRALLAVALLAVVAYGVVMASALALLARFNAATRRRRDNTARPLPCDDPTPEPDEAALLAEVTRIQQDPLTDVPLQRAPGERGGMPFGIARYPRGGAL